MGTIYVVTGTGTAPTAMASYDTALADANVHNYNLVRVSSIVPAGATIEPVARAPDLGPAGNRLTVVEGRATAVHGGRVCAGLGWAIGPGPGLFYEATGSDPEAVRETIERGLAAGRALRGWTFEDESIVVEAVEGDPEAYTTVVALAAFGESEPVL
jgi:arginine decarboxylase